MNSPTPPTQDYNEIFFISEEAKDEVDVTSMLPPSQTRAASPRPLAASTRALVRLDGGKDVLVLLEGFKTNLEGFQITGMVKLGSVWDLVRHTVDGLGVGVTVIGDDEEEKVLWDLGLLALSAVDCAHAGGKVVPVTIYLKRRG